jgi:hypothetical protein
MANWKLTGDVLLKLERDGSFAVETTSGVKERISLEEAAALHILRHHTKGLDGGVVGEGELIDTLREWGAPEASPAMFEAMETRRLVRAEGPPTRAARAKAPVFMVFCPRSGSNLLRWLLDSHPRFSCVAPSPIVNLLINLANHPWSAAAYRSLRVPKPWTRHLLRRWVDQQLVDSADGKRWCYRHWVSYRQLHYIDELFGGTPLYLYLVRHGLDVADAASRVYVAGETWQAGPNGTEEDFFKVYGGSYQLAYAKFWCEVVDRMHEFRVAHPDRTFFLRYEDLVENPEQKLYDMCAFLGEEFSPDMVAKAFKAPPKMLPAWDGHEVTRTSKIEKGRSGRWKRWDPSLVKMVAPFVNDALATWGYDRIE